MLTCLIFIVFYEFKIQDAAIVIGFIVCFWLFWWILKHECFIIIAI